ncbi:MAG: class I SAM-dependent methyltransferase [Myxococcales bacterium]|nr:class I SAM-dependent methyltransferase [Myxococcales bacterium]
MSSPPSDFADVLPDARSAWAGDARPRYPASLLNRLGNLVEGKTVLEVAAGSGDLARPLAARGFDVVALEASAKRIARGRRQPFGGRVDWVEGRPESTQLGGPFDLILAGEAGRSLDWARALPKLGRAANGWFAVAGRGLRVDGGQEALDDVLRSWSGISRKDAVDEVQFVTKLRRFRRVGHWRARSQTVLQPMPVFVRSLHSLDGLSVEALGADRVEPFRRAAEEALGRHHGGMVRLITSPWIVWGRITRGVAL